MVQKKAVKKTKKAKDKKSVKAKKTANPTAKKKVLKKGVKSVKSPSVRSASSSNLVPKKEKGKIKKVKPARYFESVGRRKTAVARVRLFTQGEKVFLINGKPYQDYFSIPENQQTAISSLDKMKSLGRFNISVKVKGGGISAQSEAVRHGVARALLKFNPDFRKKLRKSGFLTRDPRMRERKKFGLKRARRAPQWRKR